MEFLRKFFPKQKTAKFRSDIQSFMQMEDEPLSDAWDRLKWYTISCPHHGVSKGDLLWIFYQGVIDEIREALDAASYGSFTSLDVKRAEQLIEDLAQNDAWYEDDYDSTQASFQQGDFQLKGDTPSQQSQNLDIIESQVSEQQEMNEELQMEDPLEMTLVVEKDERELLSEDPNGFETMLDESEDMVVEEHLELEVTELPKDEESTKENLEGSAHDESWSELKAPKLELKPLPKGLRYAFLGTNSTHPVIINDVCDDEVKWLLVELSEYRKAIGFSLDDIQGISHSLCMHHTHLEDESKSFIEHQKGLNPNLLNAFTREDYIPLLFIDQILERLGNHTFYCSSLGVSLPILCRLLWWLSLLLLALLLQSKLKLFPGLLERFDILFASS